MVNNRARRALVAALDGLGFGAVVASNDDGTVEVQYDGGRTSLLPVWAGEGYPQDVKRVLNVLAQRPAEPRTTPVVAVRQLSQGAQALLLDRAVSWVDEAGRAAISAPPALLVRRDRPVPLTRSTAGQGAGDREMRWARGSGAVAEYVLALGADRGPGDAGVPLPPVEQVGTSIGVSAGLVSRTLQAFDAQGWTSKSGAERGASAVRTLEDPSAMLSSWAAWHSRTEPDVVLAHATYQDPQVFVRERIAAAWPAKRWAATGWLALDVRAPWTTSIPGIALYVDPLLVETPARAESFLEAAGLRRVDRGARVTLLLADRFVLRSVVRRTPFPQVGDIRLYGDLLREGVRGPDAAEHLRHTRIGF